MLKKRSICNTILTLVIMLTSTLSFAQVAIITSTSFPSTTATSCTNTFIDVNLQLGCSNAALGGITTTIVGSTVTVDIDYTIGPICFGAIAFPSHNVNMGNLPTGTNSIIVNVNWNGVLSNSSSTSLTVVSCCTAVSSFAASQLTACVGDSISFTSTSTGSTSIEWLENNVSQGGSPTYGKVYNNAGTYNIALVANATSCSDTSYATVFVYNKPTVNLGADSSICAGTSIILDAGAGLDSVLWSTGLTTQTISVNTAGTYTVDVFNNGCSATDTITVNVYTPAPFSLGADTTVCLLDTLVLSAPLNGATYLWSDNSTDSVLVVTGPGTYSLQRSDSTNCVAFDDIIVSFDATCTVNLDEDDLTNGLTLYPNPTQDALNLNLPAGALNCHIVEVFDITGKLIIQENIHFGGQHTGNISVSNLRNGIYNLKVSLESGEALIKTFKKN